MVTEHELKAALREYLEAGPPNDVTELVQQLQMELASPGDWEVAKTAPDPSPE